MKTGNDITAVILAGGKSSRMGTDKGMMYFRGKELITYVIDAVQPVVTRIFIVANDSEYMKFGFPVYQDLFKDCGPIGGIYTALTLSTTTWNLIVACDMPFVNSEVLATLIDARNTNDLVMPRQNGQSEPLCALYNKSCLPVIDKQIQSGNNKLLQLSELLKTRIVEIESVKHEINPFLNLNSREDVNIVQ